MVFNSFRRNAMVLGLLLTLPTPGMAKSNTDAPPLPAVTELTIGPMSTAFAEMPSECRKAIQRNLQRLGMYDGAANAQWSSRLGRGLIAYVHATGNLAYGWTTVAGNKGILWHSSGGVARCPMPPYDS